MKKYFGWLFAAVAILISFSAFAQAAELPATDFFAQLMAAIKAFGGLSWMGKVSSIVLLLVASMKVSFIKPLWDKLGAAKAWAGPVLGLIGGILSLGVDGNITVAGVMAYVASGAGALILHELLDTVKAIPGLGAMYVAVINWIEGLLGAKKA